MISAYMIFDRLRIRRGLAKRVPKQLLNMFKEFGRTTLHDLTMRVFVKYSYILQQKNMVLFPLAPGTAQKTHRQVLKNVISQFLFYPSLYPQGQSEKETKFLSDQFSQGDLSLFYFEQNFFFLPTVRTQQAKGFSISAIIFFLTLNENAASKGLFYFCQNYFSYP